MTLQYEAINQQILYNIVTNTIDNSPLLSTYESTLRCSICYDMIHTAVTIDVCNHTYCSLCIRRSLYFIQRCPTCNINANTNNLHTNRIIDTLVQQYNTFRESLINTLSQQLYIQLPKQTVIDTNTIYNKSSTNNTNKQLINTNNKGILQLFNNNESSRKRQQSSTTVECPVCLLPIVQTLINTHLDECLGKPDNIATKQQQQTQSTVIQQQQQNNVVMPVYNLLKDKQLRDMLRDINLPTHGDRDTLIRRHREYLLTYAAEHDSIKPASNEQIVKDIIRKEQHKTTSVNNRLGKQATLFDTLNQRNNRNNIKSIQSNKRHKHTHNKPVTLQLQQHIYNNNNDDIIDLLDENNESKMSIDIQQLDTSTTTDTHTTQVTQQQQQLHSPSSNTLTSSTSSESSDTMVTLHANNQLQADSNNNSTINQPSVGGNNNERYYSKISNAQDLLFKELIINYKPSRNKIKQQSTIHSSDTSNMTTSGNDVALNTIAATNTLASTNVLHNTNNIQQQLSTSR